MYLERSGRQQGKLGERAKSERSEHTEAEVMERKVRVKARRGTETAGQRSWNREMTKKARERRERKREEKGGREGDEKGRGLGVGREGGIGEEGRHGRGEDGRGGDRGRGEKEDGKGERGRQRGREEEGRGEETEQYRSTYVENGKKARSRFTKRTEGSKPWKEWSGREKSARRENGGGPWRGREEVRPNRRSKGLVSHLLLAFIKSLFKCVSVPLDADLRQPSGHHHDLSLHSAG